MRWVIGDIHGMFAPLETLITIVFKRDRDARLCFVGDYVNRGPDSRRVIDFLIDLGDRCGARFVRGNHDDMFDLIVNDHWLGGEEETFEPVAACNWFLKHGLQPTLDSYGIDAGQVARLAGSRPADLVRLIRDTVPESHRRFLRELPIVIDDSDCLIAHAFWPPEEENDSAHVLSRITDDAEMIHRVIWERWTNLQVLADKPWHRPAFFGHTPVSNYPPSMREEDNVPVVGPRMTLLDTAIALGLSGRLSAVAVEDGTLIQVDRGCNEVRR